VPAVPVAFASRSLSRQDAGAGIDRRA